MAALDQMDFMQVNGVWYRRKPRFYQVLIVRDATIDATFQGTIQIDPGTPFFMTSLHCGDSGDGKALTSQEPWFVSAQDNEGGYLWSDGLVERSSFFGDRIHGNRQDPIVPVKQDTRITWTIRNIHAGPTAGDAHIVMRGFSLVPVSSM